MSHRVVRSIVLLSAFTLAGCAARPGQSPNAADTPAAAQNEPNAEPSLPLINPGPAAAPDDIAYLPLDRIEPIPTLHKPTTAPATAPAEPPPPRPPLEAVVLYAKARDSLLAGRRFTAINALEQAIELDPDSAELRYALGKAYLMGKVHDGQSIAAMTRAAELDGDRLDLQTDLGRQLLARGDADGAVRHLRLALQTTLYATDDTAAATAELFLARALQQRGYDRAALEVYGRLLRRLHAQSRSLRADPQLAYLLSDRLQVDIGDLYARHGQQKDALAAYEPAAQQRPGDFEVQARVIKTLSAMGRHDDAARRAADTVARFRASRESLHLLHDVHRAAGREGGAADELARLHERQPADRAVLMALVDLLAFDRRSAEAERILARASEADPADFPLVRRRLGLIRARAGADEAARALVEILAHRPGLADEADALWAQLLRPADGVRGARLRLDSLQRLAVPPAQEAARLFAVARVAQQTRRDAVARDALERATKLIPPYPPAYRAHLEQVWARTDRDEARRAEHAEQLGRSAADAGDAALAEELRGLVLVFQMKYADAAARLARAVELGGSSPDLRFAHAAAARLAGDEAGFERLAWKLISDRPTYEGAYAALYNHLSSTGSESQAEKVLTTWQAAVPDSPSAKMLQARSYFTAGRAEAAEDIVQRLVEDHGDEPSVLAGARSLYQQTRRLDRFAELLEERLSDRPRDFAATAVLADLYAEQKRLRDASRVLDRARVAFADEADLLYQVAHLYQRAGDRGTAERVFRDVLSVDPQHPGAANDLGYGLAERGESLAEAESLTRLAARADPQNLSFLDSLGWVLYKRGRLAESRAYLDKAVAGTPNPDPVVLDHLGDVMYRQGQDAGADAQWRRAMTRLEAMPAAAAARDDLKTLKLQLQKKTRQLKSGRPVAVSPVVEEPATVPEASEPSVGVAPARVKSPPE